MHVSKVALFACAGVAVVGGAWYFVGDEGVFEEGALAPERPGAERLVLGPGGGSRSSALPRTSVPGQLVDDGETSVVGSRAWIEAKAEILRDCREFLESDRESFVEQACAWSDDVQRTADGVPDFTGAYFNPHGKTLLREDLDHLAGVAEAHTLTLEALAERAFGELVEGVCRCLENDEFACGPRGTPLGERLTEPPAQSLYGVSFLESAGNWTVHVDFHSPDHPPFHQSLLEIDELKRERLAEVRAYVDALP